jgi:hypothetical protein
MAPYDQHSQQTTFLAAASLDDLNAEARSVTEGTSLCLHSDEGNIFPCDK